MTARPEQVPWGGGRGGGPRSAEVRLGGRWFRLTEGPFVTGPTSSGGEGLWLWPCSVALAAKVAAADLSGLTALDAGCGLGLAGMVAAHRGAAVTFLDGDWAACERLKAALAANGLTGAVVNGRWPGAVRGPFGAFFAAEVLYRGYDPAGLAALIDACWAGPGPCWVANAVREEDQPGAEMLAEARGRFEAALEVAGLRVGCETLRGRRSDDGREYAVGLWDVRRRG